MNSLSVTRICKAIVSATLLLFITANFAGAQSDELRQTLFKEADSALKMAEGNEASVYAPSTFANGMSAYKRAEDELQRGGEIKDIQKRISSATENFNKSVELSKRSTAFFASVIAARNAAKKANASQFAAETWQKAGGRLEDAIKTLESANDSSARAKGVEAETAFKESELQSLKVQCLIEAQAFLKKAEEAGAKKNAPITFDKAARLLQKAEKTLEENRQDTEGARLLANQAQEEGRHAMYLSQTINRLNSEKKSLEEILLSAETQLQTISQFLGKTAHFDKGLEPVTQDILSSIRDRR